MAAPTYAQVAQGPPRQALPRSAEEIRRREAITRDKRAAEAPQAAGASRAVPRAQAPSPAMSDLQAGQAVPRPAIDSPVLDTEMVEEDRLAWQQLATGPHLRQSPDEDHPMLGDTDDVTGDDWESLDAEDFLMGEADPNHPVPTSGLGSPQQVETTFVNRQTDISAAHR